MQDKYNTQYQTARSYISALDDVAPLPLPPPLEAQASAPAQQSSLGFVITTANVLITAIIITGMIIDGEQVRNAIVTGAIYFAATTIPYILVITGTLATIVGSLARERTERQRIRAYQTLGELAIAWRHQIEVSRLAEIQAQSMPVQFDRRLAEVERLALEDRLSVAPTQRVPEAPGTFVTAFDNRSKAAHAAEVGTQGVPAVDTTAQEALRWVSDTLYDDYGKPDPRQVHLSGEPETIGRLRGKMIGSKRGEGSSEAGRWLVQAGVIQKVPGGYKLALDRFPNRGRLRHLM